MFYMCGASQFRLAAGCGCSVATRASRLPEWTGQARGRLLKRQLCGLLWLRGIALPGLNPPPSALLQFAVGPISQDLGHRPVWDGSHPG